MDWAPCGLGEVEILPEQRNRKRYQTLYGVRRLISAFHGNAAAFATTSRIQGIQSDNELSHSMESTVMNFDTPRIYQNPAILA